jgi:hypothetical protein
MKVPDIVVWTIAVVVGSVAYLCVAIAVFEVWKPAGKFMLLALVFGPFMPEFWMFVWSLARRRK